MSTAVLDRPTLDDLPAIEPPARPRLSEALRRGMQLHPPGKWYLYDLERHTTCALGALLAGLVGQERFEAFGFGSATKAVQEATGVHLGAPLSTMAGTERVQRAMAQAGIADCTLGQAIVFLNDHGNWSRERIAACLEEMGL